MNEALAGRCTTPVPLDSYAHTTCELEMGHEGEHETDAWGPRITWVGNDAGSVRA